MTGPKYNPSTPGGFQNFPCPSFYFLMNLVPSGGRCIFLKSKLPSNDIFSEGFVFDISDLNRFNVIKDFLIRPQHRCIGNIFNTPNSPAMKWFFHAQWISLLYFSCAYMGELIGMRLIFSIKVSECT